MTKIILKILFSISLIFLLLTSCTLPEIKSESPEINPVALDEKFRINLQEEHSSGYIWQLSEGFDKTLINCINNVWHGNAKGVDFNFNTLAAGQTTLTFVKRKYTDTAEIKRFIVKIRAN